MSDMVRARGVAFARRARARIRRSMHPAPPPTPTLPPPHVDDPFWMLASTPALWDDPFPYYEKMRERGPIYHARELKNQPYPHVVATGFDQVSAVFKHECIESEAFIDDSRVPGVGPQCVLMQNPPRHDEVRRKLTKGFTARAVDRLEPLIVAQS